MVGITGYINIWTSAPDYPFAIHREQRKNKAN